MYKKEIMILDKLFICFLFIALYGDKREDIDDINEEIKEKWHFFDRYLSLGDDPVTEPFILRANTILGNKKYAGNPLVHIFYPYLFGRELMKLPSHKAATILLAIESDAVVCRIVEGLFSAQSFSLIFAEYNKLFSIFNSSRFFNNEFSRSRLQKILALDDFSENAIKERVHYFCFQEFSIQKFLINRRNALLKKLKT
jgi:hypothetical protein